MNGFAPILEIWIRCVNFSATLFSSPDNYLKEISAILHWSIKDESIYVRLWEEKNSERKTAEPRWTRAKNVLKDLARCKEISLNNWPGWLWPKKAVFSKLQGEMNGKNDKYLLDTLSFSRLPGYSIFFFLDAMRSLMLWTPSSLFNKLASYLGNAVLAWNVGAFACLESSNKQCMYRADWWSYKM